MRDRTGAAQYIHNIERRMDAPIEAQRWYTGMITCSYNGEAADVLAVGSTNVDTSALFGIDAGIKAAVIMLRGRWAVAGSGYLDVQQGGGGGIYFMSAIVNTDQAAQILVPCDSNGDFTIVVTTANFTYVNLRLIAYLR